MSKEKIKAIHDDDLEVMLETLGVLKEFKSNKSICKFCNEIVSGTNLHSIFPEAGAVKFCCENPSCVKSLVAKMEKKNYG